MAIWQLKIHRYQIGGGDARIGCTQHISADDFAAATDHATILIAGMTAADRTNEYRIVSLLSHDYRGKDCEGGIYMFETAVEMSARLAAEKP